MHYAGAFLQHTIGNRRQSGRAAFARWQFYDLGHRSGFAESTRHRTTSPGRTIRVGRWEADTSGGAYIREPVTWVTAEPPPFGCRLQ